VSIPIPRARICGAFPFSRSSTDRANLARARTRNTYYVCTFVRTYVRMCVCVCLSHMRANPRVHECRNIIVAGLIHRNAAPKVANVGSAKLTNSPPPPWGEQFRGMHTPCDFHESSTHSSVRYILLSLQCTYRKSISSSGNFSGVSYLVTST